MTIKDILKINLDEEINTVVDLDNNPTDAALKEGLDSFVLTQSLGKHLQDFLEEYNGGTMQSGVWLSGFYGSGKSYFAQIIGLLLQNKTIFGTPMRDRFGVKIDGLPNENLLKHEIGSLDRINNIVVSFDASKHNNVNGLPYMIFGSFLRNLGMTDSWHGIIEFDIFIEGKREQFLDAVKQNTGKDWSEIIKSNTEMVRAFKPALLSMGYTEEEFSELKSMAMTVKNEYDAARLKQDLSRFLDLNPDTRIVFFIDEVSEAITQKKIRLDDLEGVAEALAALGRKVWTIAIAQQRLDDVIKAENIALNSLTKVRDRFRTKIAIEADEVDTIIRHRLLAKTDESRTVLGDYFASANGAIADVTNIGVPSLRKTTDVETYIAYYPFYMHQFKLLQYFLFGSSELTQTRVGNRGMIISAFDVLKKEVKDVTSEHYHVNATQLCNQADDRVEESLSLRYRQAEDTLHGAGLDLIQGKKLLQTIHFLVKSEVTHTTIDNITKSYINHPEDFHETRQQIKKALDILQRQQIVIVTGEQYRITNEAEQRILDDMRRFDVQTWEKAQDINNILKNRDFIKGAGMLSLPGMNVRFKVANADGEVFQNGNENNLSVVVCDLLSCPGKDDETLVNQVRRDTADSKGVLTLIPTVQYRDQISELITDLRRLKYIEEKTNLSDEEKLIVHRLCSERDTKVARLHELVEASYLSGVAVYCYNKLILTPETFKTVVAQQQEKMFENIFTKRLSAELSDSLASGVFTRQAGQLHNYFGTSTDFKFFDTAGTFIGNNLLVVSEILGAASAFTSGKDLENKLTCAPTGFSLGTIMTTLAALFRGDKVIVKFAGEEYTSCRQPGATDAFKNARNFVRASFKAISQGLSYNEKREIVDILKEECNYKKHTRQDISYQLNDFEIVDAIRSLSKALIQRVNNEIEATDYEPMFPMAKAAKQVLQQYQATVTEANYLRTAKSFLMETNTDEFIKAVERITGDLRFISEKMREVRRMENYLEEVKDQFEKTRGNYDAVKEKIEDFNMRCDADVVHHYADLKKDVQDVRDIYNQSFKTIAQKVSAFYTSLLEKLEGLKSKLSQYPRQWNASVWFEMERLIVRFSQYTNISTTFDPYSVKSLRSRLDLRDVVNASENIPTLENKIYVLDAQVHDTDPNPPLPPEPQPKPGDEGTPTPPTPPTTPQPKTHKLKSQLPQGDVPVAVYKQWLTRQLALLSSFGDNDKINLTD